MKVTIELKQGRCMTIKIIYDSTTTPRTVEYGFIAIRR